MLQVQPSSYINTLKTIAEDPVKAVSQFPMITPSHKTAYSMDYLEATTSCIIGVLSTMVFKRSKSVSILLFSVASIFLYQSFKSNLVETDAFIQQTQQINDLFNPCIKGLMKEREAKVKVITDTIHEKPKQSAKSIKDSIDKVAAIYDGLADTNTYPDQIIGNRLLDLESYNSLKENATQLSAFSITSSCLNEQKVAPLAKQKLERLLTEAALFINGDNKGKAENNENAYVRYGWWNDKAIISPLPRKNTL